VTFAHFDRDTFIRTVMEGAQGLIRQTERYKMLPRFYVGWAALRNDPACKQNNFAYRIASKVKIAGLRKRIESGEFYRPIKLFTVKQTYKKPTLFDD
jgi:hypothetical protein